MIRKIERGINKFMMASNGEKLFLRRTINKLLCGKKVYNYVSLERLQK